MKREEGRRDRDRERIERVREREKERHIDSPSSLFLLLGPSVDRIKPTHMGDQPTNLNVNLFSLPKMFSWTHAEIMSYQLCGHYLTQSN
jgi:hypothetical protein